MHVQYSATTTQPLASSVNHGGSERHRRGGASGAGRSPQADVALRIEQHVICEVQERVDACARTEEKKLSVQQSRSRERERERKAASPLPLRSRTGRSMLQRY